MKFKLIAVGNKMPSWISNGFSEYQRRFARDLSLQLLEIPAGKRSKKIDLERLIAKEGEAMLAAAKGCHIITLDILGKPWDTKELAKQINNWQLTGRDIAMLVGGPEGLAERCKQQADQSWSLSKLTLPHPLVRIIVAESLYRAWSINNNHPYHKE